MPYPVSNRRVVDGRPRRQDVESLEATREFTPPRYATLADVPPQEEASYVYVLDEQRYYFEDGN